MKIQILKVVRPLSLMAFVGLVSPSVYAQSVLEAIFNGTKFAGTENEPQSLRVSEIINLACGVSPTKNFKVNKIELEVQNKAADAYVDLVKKSSLGEETLGQASQPRGNSFVFDSNEISSNSVVMIQFKGEVILAKARLHTDLPNGCESLKPSSGNPSKLPQPAPQQPGAPKDIKPKQPDTPAVPKPVQPAAPTVPTTPAVPSRPPTPITPPVKLPQPPTAPAPVVRPQPQPPIPVVPAPVNPQPPVPVAPAPVRPSSPSIAETVDQIELDANYGPIFVPNERVALLNEGTNSLQGGYRWRLGSVRKFDDYGLMADDGRNYLVGYYLKLVKNYENRFCVGQFVTVKVYGARESRRIVALAVDYLGQSNQRPIIFTGNNETFKSYEIESDTGSARECSSGSAEVPGSPYGQSTPELIDGDIQINEMVCYRTEERCQVTAVMNFQDGFYFLANGARVLRHQIGKSVREFINDEGERFRVGGIYSGGLFESDKRITKVFDNGIIQVVNRSGDLSYKDVY